MAKIDDRAPKFLTATITDENGKVFGIVPVSPKNFSTGSVGFYGNGKIVNINNPEAKYQCGLTFTLIGSKE
jgi:hypothetical protein